MPNDKPPTPLRYRRAYRTGRVLFVIFRVNPDERKIIHAAAKRAGKPVGDWALAHARADLETK